MASSVVPSTPEDYSDYVGRAGGETEVTELGGRYLYHMLGTRPTIEGTRSQTIKKQTVKVINAVTYMADEICGP